MVVQSVNTKLNIRYHNPNTDSETIKYISQIFIEASRAKFQNILQETAAKHNADTDESSPDDGELLFLAISFDMSYNRL